MSKSGAGTSSITVTPLDKLKRQAKRRRKQEQEWAAKAGPVEVRHV